MQSYEYTYTLKLLLTDAVFHKNKDVLLSIPDNKRGILIDLLKIGVSIEDSIKKADILAKVPVDAYYAFLREISYNHYKTKC